MKALVLAAGLGTRLRPYTDVLPKPLFPVLGAPSICWVLAGLREAGITDVVVNLHHLPDAIVSALGDGAACGMRIRYSHEHEILGTGGALVAARGLLDDGAPFLVHNADIFNDWDLALLKGARAPALAVTDGPGLPDSDRRVELAKGGSVAGLRGLPTLGNGRMVVYGGVALVDGAVVDRLASSMPGAAPGRLRAACLVADALIPMLRDGVAVNIVEYESGWYCDTGTPESYLDLNFRALLNVEGLMGRRGFRVPVEVEPGVFVARGASVGRNVRFRGPAMVCDGASVGDGASIGPRAVVSGRVAGGIHVAEAVVMAGAAVTADATGIVMPVGGANG